MIFFLFIQYNIAGCYSLELPLPGSSNEYPQHVLWRNTDIYANMPIYHQMPSLSVSLDQIQKISKIDSILFTYLFIYLFKKRSFIA